MLKAGLIGFGSISRAHRKAYLALEQQGIVELVAACDVDPAAFSRTVQINIEDDTAPLQEHLRYYTVLDDMLANEELDFVDVCLPTYLHAPTAVTLLQKGLHVLCEKPMALTFASAKEMLCAAHENGRELMIGQCLRFYPAFDYVKVAVDEHRFGDLLGGLFLRLSPLPTWGWQNWFADPARSGGGITDFHIHDVDIIRYLFGEPDAVSSRGTSSFSLYDTVHTALYYGNVPITAVADWTHAGLPFQATCYLDFVGATLRFDGQALTVADKRSGSVTEVPLSGESGYYGEIAYFCEVVSGRTQNTKNPAASAARSLDLIELIRKSADAGGERLPFIPR